MQQQSEPQQSSAAPAAKSAGASEVAPESGPKAQRLGGSGSLLKRLVEAAGGRGGAPPQAKALPHKAAMESRFGQSFGDVKAYVGDPAVRAGLTALGAEAAAEGNEVAFSSASPSPELVAHELAHVVQQGPGTQGSASAGGLEAEAQKAGQAAAAGQAPQVKGHAPAGLQKADLNGDPREIAAQADATGATTVYGAQHKDVDISQGHGYAPKPNTPVGQSGERSVKVKRAAANPIKAASPPPDAALYDELPEAMGGAKVTATEGSAASPMVKEQADPAAIYIKGKASADDVIQQGIGDCYFMSALIAMASRDPGRLRRQVIPDGAGGATVVLFRWAKKAEYDLFENLKAIWNLDVPNPYYHYEPVTVSASRSLIHWVDAGGADFGLRSAGFRVAEQPNPLKEWWANLDGQKLEVHRKDTYELALWVALLEKAFARFSEQYGQYGREGEGKGGSASASSGYANIDGGWSHKAMAVLYGREAEGFDQDWSAYDPADNSLAQNWPALQKLLLLEGRGDQARDEDKDAPLITATSMTYQVSQRLVAQIAHIKGDPSLTAELGADTWTDVNDLDVKAQAYVASQSEADMKTMAAAAVKLATLGAGKHADLFDGSKSRPIRALMELVVTLRNSGTDNSPGQRWVYSNHVYGILSTEFKLRNGTPIALAPLMKQVPPTWVPLFLSMVDPAQSNIKLRNPHHGNEPDAQNSGPADGKNDGVFVLSVEQFFTTFTSVEGGVVPRS